MVCKLVDVQPKAAIVDNEIFTVYEAIWFHRIKKGDDYFDLSRASRN